MENFFSRLVLSQARRYYLGRHILFWLACWLFMGFIYGFINIEGHQVRLLALSYLEALLYLPQHMVLSYGIIYFILPRYVMQGLYWRGLATTLILITVVAAISPVIANFLIAPLRGYLGIPFNRHGIMYAWLLAGLRGSMTVAGFAVAIKLIKLWYLKKVDNEKLEKEKLRAELEILRGQLNPHFMFNTLNSIYSMALQRSDQTPAAILKLSQLMRYMLTECKGEVVELTKEVQVLTSYIDLEKGRFAQRLDMMLNIEGDLSNKRIPPLLLIPFVENSFKHGANEMIEQAWISLDLKVHQSELKLKLINGKPHDESVAVFSHIGLSNVQRRLELLYPNAHELRITQDEDTFVVGLTLQLDRVQLPG